MLLFLYFLHLIKYFREMLVCLTMIICFFFPLYFWFLLYIFLFLSCQMSKKEKKKMKSFSRAWLFATSWTVACQPPPSMEFSRQEYWSKLPFHSPGDLPNPGIERGFPPLQADSLPSEPQRNLVRCLWFIMSIFVNHIFYH